MSWKGRSRFENNDHQRHRGTGSQSRVCRFFVVVRVSSDRVSFHMDDKKHIHLIGICGTAMASLAGMLKQRGFRVTGSDAAAYPPMSEFLRVLGIPVAQPFDARTLEPRPDLVVVGNAISRGNVELEQLLDQRIPFCSMPQLLHDEFLRTKEVLVVAGTHGKTTTTSMLAWIFDTAGLQPSVLLA